MGGAIGVHVCECVWCKNGKVDQEGLCVYVSGGCEGGLGWLGWWVGVNACRSTLGLFSITSYACLACSPHMLASHDHLICLPHVLASYDHLA